jgi:glycosyltransferase involved in cell wall biosynthesis/predicted Zn-dependent protease
MRRYLFGPVTAAFAVQNLDRQRCDGSCLTFGSEPGVDLAIAPGDTWAEVAERLPRGWSPDFLVLFLWYSSIPRGLWSAPVPIVGLAGDPNLLWHYYRLRLPPSCDLVLTDTTGVEVMAWEGIGQARAANLFGWGGAGLQPAGATEGRLQTCPTPERRIDALFIGNLHPAVQRERLLWVARLARLAERWNVQIHQGIFGDEYRQLLGRARIVFNRGIRRECNMRTFEAAAAGALLFQEAENREVPEYFRDRRECVYYTDENLEELLEYYLEHEEERRAIAEAGRARVTEYTFENLWDGALETIEREWPGMEERARRRSQRSGVRGQESEDGNWLDLAGRVWERLCGTAAGDEGLERDLAAALLERPEEAEWHNALGLLAADGARREGLATGEQARRALGYFERAVRCDPEHVLARLNLVEALAVVGGEERAVAEARRLLAELNRFSAPTGRRSIAQGGNPGNGEPTPSHQPCKSGRDGNGAGGSVALSGLNTGSVASGSRGCAPLHPGLLATTPLGLSSGHFPTEFDFFRVEWERAAWLNAGRPRAEKRAKVELIRWRLHGLLAELTGELGHYYEAVAARPDLPNTRAALGCALGRQGRAGEAVPHLRLVVEGSPFDLNAARALYQALGEAGDVEGQRELARDRALLARAAPRVVPPELWFDEKVRSPWSVVRGQEKASADLSSLRTNHNGLRTQVLQAGWEGPFRAAHSLGLVNREVCRRLIERGHQIALQPIELPAGEVPEEALSRALELRLGCAPAHAAEVHVRHRWPPDFTPPAEGRLVVFQHWEFGSLPQAWVEAMSGPVDEVWVASRYARECFVRSGVPAERVQVVPLGVDPGRFAPQAPPLPLATGKRFKFLFVGGTLYRKGIDILLDAYAEAFERRDDVCLVIKDMGVGSFYRGQTAEQRIAELQARRDAPEILYFEGALSEEELAGLYTACDCLVHPYRGEGFGLPIAEAMASGLPVIVTDHGAALDFCNRDNAFLIPTRVVRFAERRVGDVETVDHPWLAEPDRQALVALLRATVKDNDERRRRADAGLVHIHKHFTWDHTADAVEERLRALCRPAAASFGPEPAATALAGTVAAGSGPNEGLMTTDAGRAARVSLCMIVKNEEENLPACLESVEGMFDETIVVDTGSTDRTRQIAQRWGCRVVDFPWVDSFAAARNESLRHATGDWIFWMDADDRLDEENRRRLRQLFPSLGAEKGVGTLVGQVSQPADGGGRLQTCPTAAYVMKCVCLPDPATGTTTVVDHVRLFRNHPSVRWEHRIHEQILPAIRRAGGGVQFTDIAVHHAGYQDASVRERKRQRDLRLLKLEQAERPDHPFTLFNLGSSYLDLGRPAEALPFLQRSLQRSSPGDSIVRKLYYLIVQCHRRLGQAAEALEVCRGGRGLYPQDAELLNQEAQLRSEQGDLAGAETCFLDLLGGQDGAHFASIPEGLRGHITRHNLAVIYRQQGRLAEAEAQWQAALAGQPDYLPSRLGLGDLYLHQQRWADVDKLAGRLSDDPREPFEGRLLQARSLLARRRFSEARELVHAVIHQYPQAVRPRLVLTHVLLQEERDLEAAEQALRDVLALDPSHPEALHNLAVLNHRRAGAA